MYKSKYDDMEKEDILLAKIEAQEIVIKRKDSQIKMYENLLEEIGVKLQKSIKQHNEIDILDKRKVEIIHIYIDKRYSTLTDDNETFFIDRALNDIKERFKRNII